MGLFDCEEWPAEVLRRRMLDFGAVTLGSSSRADTCSPVSRDSQLHRISLVASGTVEKVLIVLRKAYPGQGLEASNSHVNPARFQRRSARLDCSRTSWGGIIPLHLLHTGLLSRFVSALCFSTKALSRFSPSLLSLSPAQHLKTLLYTSQSVLAGQVSDEGRASPLVPSHSSQHHDIEPG